MYFMIQKEQKIIKKKKIQKTQEIAYKSYSERNSEYLIIGGGIDKMTEEWARMEWKDSWATFMNQSDS